MARKRSRSIPMLALACTLASCASHGGHQYHDANMDFGSLKTVAVLPFVNLTRDQAAGERVRDVFSNMLLASGSIYVLPPGELARGIARLNIANPAAPSTEEVTKLGGLLKADGIVGGTVKEYGEVRSGSATGNVVSVSVEMYEVASGKVIWAASASKGGVTLADRMFGGGGSPVNDVTEQVVDDLLNKLFK